MKTSSKTPEMLEVNSAKDKEKNRRFRTICSAHVKVFNEEGTRMYNAVEDAMAELASVGLPVKASIRPGASEKRVVVEKHRGKQGSCKCSDGMTTKVSWGKMLEKETKN